MEYKWITITVNEEFTKPTMKTKVFDVKNKENGSYLGRIGWFPTWRKYAFAPAQQTVFEATCMTDIAAFLTKLMQDRKMV